jgi:DNA-binding NarL/FixJ family response regulator
VLIGHPTPLVREGIEAVAERSGKIRVTGQTGNKKCLLDMASQLLPDVVLTTIDYGEGAEPELIRELRASCRAALLVMVSGGKTCAVAKAVSAGATGCIMEDAPPDVFRIAIQEVAEGRTWVQRELTEPLVAGLRKAGKSSEARSGDPLTEREREVVALVCAGRDNATVAEALSVEPGTVRAHVSHILQKLGLGNRVELALYAIRKGLVRP